MPHVFRLAVVIGENEIDSRCGGNSKGSRIRPDVLAPLDFLEKPGPGESPVIFNRGNRNAENLRYLLIFPSAEIAKLDHLRLNRMFLCELVKRLIYGQ